MDNQSPNSNLHHPTPPPFNGFSTIKSPDTSATPGISADCLPTVQSWFHACFIDPVFHKYGVYSGRTTRKVFWLTMLTYFLIFTGLLGLLQSQSGENNTERMFTSSAMLSGMISLILMVYVSAMISPMLALSVRRLHDAGKSGQLIMIVLIPCAIFLFFSYLAIADSIVAMDIVESSATHYILAASLFLMVILWCLPSKEPASERVKVRFKGADWVI